MAEDANGTIWAGTNFGLFQVEKVGHEWQFHEFEFKNGFEFATTVTIAHVSYGFTLSILLMRLNKGIPNIWLRLISPQLNVNLNK